MAKKRSKKSKIAKLLVRRRFLSGVIVLLTGVMFFIYLFSTLIKADDMQTNFPVRFNNYIMDTKYRDKSVVKYDNPNAIGDFCQIYVSFYQGTPETSSDPQEKIMGRTAYKADHSTFSPTTDNYYIEYYYNLPITSTSIVRVGYKLACSPSPQTKLAGKGVSDANAKEFKTFLTDSNYKMPTPDRIYKWVQNGKAIPDIKTTSPVITSSEMEAIFPANINNFTKTSAQTPSRQVQYDKTLEGDHCQIYVYYWDWDEKSIKADGEIKKVRGRDGYYIDKSELQSDGHGYIEYDIYLPVTSDSVLRVGYKMSCNPSEMTKKQNLGVSAHMKDSFINIVNDQSFGMPNPDQIFEWWFGKKVSTKITLSYPTVVGSGSQSSGATGPIATFTAPPMQPITVAGSTNLGIQIPGCSDANVGYELYIKMVLAFAVNKLGLILAVLMVIYGGYRWLFSRGEENEIKEGKEIIVSAILGYAFLFLIPLTANILGLNVGDLEEVPCSVEQQN